jgi:hypothetical protein
MQPALILLQAISSAGAVSFQLLKAETDQPLTIPYIQRALRLLQAFYPQANTNFQLHRLGSDQPSHITHTWGH